MSPLKSKLFNLVAVSAIATLVAAGVNLQPAAAGIWSWKGHACRGAVFVTVEIDNTTEQPPIVSYSYKSQSGQLNITSSSLQLTGQDQHMVYQYYGDADPQLPDNAVGQININGGQAGTFTVDGGQCPVLGRIVGSAFIDTNQNGIWDKDEPTFGAAWMKVTGGGSWFVCGWMGDDATFGVTVKPNTYYILPVAPKGYRTTTPKLTVQIKNLGYVAFDTNIGFIADPKAPGDACDQYNPPRP